MSSDTVTVLVVPIPDANAGADQFALEGNVVQLTGSGDGMYSWSPADSVSNATVANPTLVAKQNITLTLTVADSINAACTNSDDVTIFVERPIVVVNTFTPNRDGVNDDWVIKNIESFPRCLVKIYNRWGNLVWRSDGYSKPWDGVNMYNDQVLPDGTYFYIIELNSTIFKNPYQGWVQIIR
jgi:gliding motility-associated-like protein